MSNYTQFRKDFTENVIGYSAMGIILSTCMGSVAVMATLMHGHGLLQMAVVMGVVAICGAHNAAILTIQKPKLILGLLLSSTLFSTVVIALSALL